MKNHRVLTFGEAMLRWTPTAQLPIALANSFDVYVAGSEANVATGLASLGMTATWVSRLPDNPLGHRVESTLRGYGVDVSHVVWANASTRLGMLFAEQPAEPRRGHVVYDRKNSAAASLAAVDLPDSLLRLHTHLHLTGITPALSASCAETMADVISRARESGMTVSFDVNYRVKLWKTDEAARGLAPFLQDVDVLFCSSLDAARLFGCEGNDAERARALAGRFGAKLTVVTAGANGAVACEGERILSCPVFPVERTIERFGSGDAFVAGFLWSHLAGHNLERSVRAGCAAAALKRTIPGDALVTTPAELEVVMGSGEHQWR